MSAWEQLGADPLADLDAMLLTAWESLPGGRLHTWRTPLFQAPPDHDDDTEETEQ